MKRLDHLSSGNIILLMRTTILLEDALARRFKETAQKRGQSLSAFLVEAGRAALDKEEMPPPPFKLITRGGKGVYPDIDLDKPGELLAADDEEIYRKNQ